LSVQSDFNRQCDAVGAAMKMAQGVAGLLERVTAWASLRPEIRALILVGSYARGAACADSDVDLVIVSERPAELLNDRAWVTAFGAIDREVTEDWGQLVSVRAWYANGPEVEFGVTGVGWASGDPSTLAVLEGGFRVLLDRDALFGFLNHS
jgi:predicted nucleotidyltransferase